MINLKESDSTGRSSITRNVLWSWTGYLIIFSIGFLMPRMIDEFIGQANLGIWDFTWSVVSYLGFNSFGIGSSVNRYVAKFQATEEFDKLSETVSSVFAVQVVGALLMILGAATIAWILPIFYSDKFGTSLKQGQLIMIILGASVSVQQLFNVFRGIITGCHRWDVHNFLEVFLRIISFVAMFFILKNGFGLVGIALAYFISVTLTELFRYICARHICPQFSLKLRYVTWNCTKKMMIFGWKTVLATLSPIILQQTTSVVVAGVLGPASLAILSRAMGLINRTETFINRYSFITTPIAGAMQVSEDSHALNKFIIDSARFVATIVIPIILVFIIFGRDILALWMGENYARGSVLAILASGYFFSFTQSPLLRIIIGLNRHGRLGIMSLSVCISIFAFCLFFIFWYGWSLETAILLIAVPTAIGNGLLIPIYASRILSLSLGKYFSTSILKPFLCNIPFMVVLVCIELWLSTPLFRLTSTAFIGGPIIIFTYWFFLLEPSQKARLRRKIQTKLGIT